MPDMGVLFVLLILIARKAVLLMVVKNALDMAPNDKNAADMWLALCYFVQPGTDCAEAVASLAELACVARVSVKTAKKGLQRLAETGLISAERITSGGRIMTTRYLLAMPEKRENSHD